VIISRARTAALQERDAGVSLLEVLAALAIFALVTGTVVVMMRPDDAPHRVEGERLMRVLHEARQEALVTGRLVGFSSTVDGRGYAFYRFDAGQWQRRIDHPAFELHRFTDPELILSVTEGAITSRGGDETGEGPQIWFDPTGLDASFVYELRSPDGVVRLSRDGQGVLSLTDPDRGEEV